MKSEEWRDCVLMVSVHSSVTAEHQLETGVVLNTEHILVNRQNSLPS